MSVLSVIQAVIATIFLLFVCSYYVLLFWPRKKGKLASPYKDITIIVPAHNEQKHIAECLAALKAARWKGTKRIIVVDDGSSDDTFRIAKQHGVTVLRQPHTGKAAALNRALVLVKSPLVAVVDADSVIDENALIETAKRFYAEHVGAVCAVISVRDNKNPIGIWLHLEQLYGALVRSLLSKINANIVAAGPLTTFRTSALRKIKGFSVDGYSEDVDIAIRLQEARYRVEFADKARVGTYMPRTWKGIVAQRRRFARGWVNIFQKHTKVEASLLRLYALPLALFSYFQAVILAPIIVYSFLNGYITYFVDKDIYVSWLVVRYLLNWFTGVGLIEWMYRLFSGAEAWTVPSAIGVASALLSYPLYFVAAWRFEGKLRLSRLIAIFLLFPFWLFIMIIYILNIDAWFRKKQVNRWHKST